MRRLQFAALGLFMVVAALTTGADFIYFLVYLGVLAIGGAYLLARTGLSDLEAGALVERQHATVGDTLMVTYTVRNRGRLPKPWLEVNSPSTLPAAIPGRAISVGGRSQRTWLARVPLVRRGQFRVDPMVVRTGDPLGLFESVASVGSGAGVIVYPRVEPLPRWRLPPAPIEGSNAHPERSLQPTPLVTTVRPYVTGDAFNHIHWRSSARHQELQVKEFDAEQTADAWIFLDLDRAVHLGEGDDATVETAVRACAAVAARALDERRAVGFEAIGLRRTVLPVDRGTRQHQKIMGLLAVVQPDGVAPLREMLVDGLARLRRGMIAVVVTPSLDREWVRPLAGLRLRGIATVVCLVDPLSHEERTHAALGWPGLPPEERGPLERDLRAMRHALAEHELRTYVLSARVPLGDQMVEGTPSRVPATLR